jgi:hypothetical protein
MGVEVIPQKGLGKGDVATTIKHVINIDINYVALTNVIFTYPAEYFPEMVRILDEKPNVGMVYGNWFNNHSYLGKRRNILYTGNRAIALIHNLLNGVNMYDTLTDLRVVRWEIFKD